MDDAAADYHSGSMNITEQVETYKAFGAMSKWGSLLIAVSVLVFTLWFCVGAGFMGGVIPGLVVAIAGIWFLRSKPQDH